MKKKLLFLIAITLFLMGSVFAQIDINATTYTFSRNGFAPATLSSPLTLIGSNSDNVASAVTEIGFTFWFAGTPYTQFSVSENGLLTLGGVQISGNDITNNLASATTLPKIAPYWDDLATGTNGSVVYQVTGSAPGRILIINWNVTVPKNAAGAANALIQVQLTETSGTITFTYGSPAVSANANLYTVGIGKAVGDFASVTPTSASAATVAYGVSNNSISISPGVYTRYNFVPDKTAPAISAQTIPNSFGTANRTLIKTITDAKTGVPTSGGLVPRIYYKKSTDVTWVSTPGVWSTPSTWTFTVDHTLLAGVVGGDQIDYYVVAQDQATTTGTPNIASYPAGVVATDVNTITTPPVTPSFYLIGSDFSGIKTVGTGGDFLSLTNAGGIFDQMNAGQVSGNLTINIISDLTGETGTKSLNAWVNAPGGPFTVTIQPVGLRTVSGSNANLKFTGTSGVTLDGLNDGVNSLTILGGVSINAGASNNLITRLTITGAQAIYSTDASGTFPVNCSNNTISNNIIEGMIYFGSWVSATGLNNVINNNIIRNFGQYGIHIDRGYRNFTISNNDIYQTGTGNYSTGIYIYNEAGTTNIFNNKIHDLRSGTGLGVWTAGIYYRFGLATDVLNIYNNVIYLDATTTNTASYQLYGLQMEGAGTSNISYNSIYIGGTGVTTGNSAGLYRTGGTVNFINNAVYNARSFTGIVAGYKNYGINVSNITNFTSDHNLIFVNGVNSVLIKNGAVEYATLTSWTTATGKDVSSVSADPGFTSPTDLHPDLINPNAANLDDHGVPIANIGIDILGNSRSTSLPTPTDIGAYEFAIPYKTLNLNLFLEGLYSGPGMMNPAFDANGPHWTAGIADHITVELRDAATYSAVVHTVNDVLLSTTGAATITLPPTINGNYYITVKHRNSIETTTPSTISFAGGIIGHDFTTSAAQAYGNNLKNSGGVFIIYGGDVNQDGSVDTGDMLPVDNDSFNYVFGYLNSDVNGDGSVDTGDMIIVDNNSANYVGTQHP